MQAIYLLRTAATANSRLVAARLEQVNREEVGTEFVYAEMREVQDGAVGAVVIGARVGEPALMGCGFWSCLLVGNQRSLVE